MVIHFVGVDSFASIKRQCRQCFPTRQVKVRQLHVIIRTRHTRQFGIVSGCVACVDSLRRRGDVQPELCVCVCSGDGADDANDRRCQVSLTSAQAYVTRERHCQLVSTSSSVAVAAPTVHTGLICRWWVRIIARKKQSQWLRLRPHPSYPIIDEDGRQILYQ